MSATLIDAVAVAAKAAIDAADISVDGRELKVYDYEPTNLDQLPVFYLAGPRSIGMVLEEDEEGQSQLGTLDWRLVFDFTLHVRADNHQAGARAARATIGQIIRAINVDNQTLNASALLGAAITDAELNTDDTVAQTRVATYAGSLVALCLSPIATP